jgi:hypothetical protein
MSTNTYGGTQELSKGRTNCDAISSFTNDSAYELTA